MDSYCGSELLWPVYNKCLIVQLKDSKNLQVYYINNYFYCYKKYLKLKKKIQLVFYSQFLIYKELMKYFNVSSFSVLKVFI